MTPKIKAIIKKSEGFLIDFFESFTPQLEQELQTPANHAIGRSHGEAQIILIGVSRSLRKNPSLLLPSPTASAPPITH